VEDLQNNMGELSEMANQKFTLVDCGIWFEQLKTQKFTVQVYYPP
jgi:hypothetical protein